MHRRRKQLLTEDDLELWKKVADSVTPLGPKARSGTDRNQKPATPDVENAPPPKRPRKAKPTSTAKQPVPPQSARAQNQFDSNLNKRITRRTGAPDASIDLHGMRQAEAHRALRQFLSMAQARGHRLVAVITGKGRTSWDDAEWWERDRPGVLRRVVPQWFGLPEFQPYIVGHRSTPRAQGGEGVIYVQIRQRRKS